MSSPAGPPPAASRWSRAYPPLGFLALAVLIAAFILPSSLNLPQTNPSTVLEYAPVPPEDEEPNPPPGNLSSLGLGSSGTLSIGGQPPPPPPPAAVNPRGRTQRASAKKCVGSPPRQSEDPMAPPCVPYFDGDNFGGTYQGVTKDEITVLVYLDRGCPNYECAPDSRTYHDLDDPPKPVCPKTWPSDNPERAKCDYIWIRMSRALNLYFNQRFQIYGRRVHYFAYVTGAANANDRRSDAQDNWTRYKPFAVIDYATYQGFNEAYDDAMAARGVMVFTRQSALPNSLFVKNAPFMWGFWPDVEHWTDQYSSYVCNRIVPYKVQWGGNPRGRSAAIGGDRKYGLWYTRDPSQPGLRLFAEKVKQRLKACGVASWHEGTFEESGFIVNNSDKGTDAADAVSKFVREGVTTVLYLGGTEGKFTQAAARFGYYPEIVLAGDLELDNNQAGRIQNQEVWQNAWGTQFQIRIDRPEEAWGYRAMKEADPTRTPEEARFANEMYRDHYMLFQAVQVAGPELTPESVDKGFHAIPTHSSTNPNIGSFFFEPGDYSALKDDMEVWWDPDGISPDGNQPGCLRMVAQGKRYLPADWPKSATTVFVNPDDPCTGYEGRYQIDPG